ncbi:hypothetical protein EDC04DRAFT_2825591, partial [Pisolithus marmoratus]
MFQVYNGGACLGVHVVSRKCNRRHPPGRKAYQRGVHTIWEVDSAINKVYCQNLSLFGKSFIDDVKTLFFDSSNCFTHFVSCTVLFDILTDADLQ